MARSTILTLLLLALLALPTGAFAQGDDEADETGAEEEAPAPVDETTEDAPAPVDETAEDAPLEPTPEVDAVEAVEVEPEEAEAAPPAVEPAPVQAAPAAVEASDRVGAPDEAALKSAEVKPTAASPNKDAVGFNKPGTRYRRLGTAISLSIGGSRVAVFDEGLKALREESDFQLAQWELGVMVTPRLGVSVSGMTSPGRVTRVNGPYDETDASGLWVDVEPTVAAWEASVRFVATPPFFPVRGFVRAGGGMYLVHVRLTDSEASGNLRQRDYRGTAPFATVGLGAEIATPTHVRSKAIPVAMGLVIEGGARVGGGGEVVAAPSSQLDQLGGVDLGPWYFRVAFQTSFWPAPKVPRAVQ